MYEQKYSYEISRIQLRSYSTQGEYKAENSYIKTGKRSNFILPMSVPPPRLQSSVPEERTLFCYFFLREKEKSGMCIQCSSFSESCSRDQYLSCLTWGADIELAYFGCLVAADSKGEWGQLTSVKPESLQCHRSTPEGEREIMSS